MTLLPTFLYLTMTSSSVIAHHQFDRVVMTLNGAVTSPTDVCAEDTAQATFTLPQLPGWSAKDPPCVPDEAQCAAQCRLTNCSHFNYVTTSVTRSVTSRRCDFFSVTPQRCDVKYNCTLFKVPVA